MILFIVVFACRWLLGTFAGLNQWTPQPPASDVNDGMKGTAFDAVTPMEQDEELHNMLKGRPSEDKEDEEQFSPLSPPKLSTKIDGSPEALADALRRMTDE
ncbi:hypothetical protein [Paenibacillus sp. YYML68]|uniref:hypothetical protein n=1 Tax=Paenibacillus sp. YYML68 TaxID=2909250 RepID=UPI00249318DF|nr:hypothetical protein [Paenibacillus sp. YYML68]